MFPLRHAPAARDTEGGFTMVEILVVIIIIGILAAIAVPIFLSQRRAANTSALQQDMRTAAQAMTAYFVAHDYKDAGNSHMGWAVIVKNGTDAQFAGDHANPTPGVLPEGMPEFPVTEGTGIGIVSYINAASGERSPGGFCVVGNAVNSDYELEKSTPGVSAYASALFYDSEAGGLTKPEDLSTTGACSIYAVRIAEGR